MTDGYFKGDEEKELEWAEKVQLVLDLRARGEPWAECSSRTGWSPGHCVKMVREAAQRVRAQNHHHVNQRYLEHDARLEWLYDTVARRIHALAVAGDVDEKLVRAAVTVLERQSKLHGLDARPAAGGRNNLDWLDDDKPIADVIREAEALGITVPGEFRVVAGLK